MAFWTRVRNVFRRDRINAEIEEELQQHIEHATEAGRDPAEARRAFGPHLRLREECQDAKLVTWISSLWQDLLYSLRSLKGNPVYSITAIITLGCGLGLNLAFFTVMNALMRPVAVPDPYSLATYSFQGNGDVDMTAAFHARWQGPDWSRHWADRARQRCRDLGHSLAYTVCCQS